MPVILLLLLPATAHALVELHYVRGPGAEQCPDQAALEKAVLDRLGFDPFQAAAERRIFVTVEKQNDDLVASLAVTTRERESLGEQRFNGAPIDCRDLSRALALALSMAIDPHSLDEAPEPAPKPPPKRSPVVSIVRHSTSVAVPQDAWRAVFGLSTTLGSSPLPAVGAHLGIEFRRQRFSIELGGRADLPVATAAIAGPFATSLVVAEIAPCYRPLWRLDLCALGMVGTEVSTDSGDVPRHSSTDPYAAAGGRISGDLLDSGPFALRLSAEAAVPFIRRRFVADLSPGPVLIWNTPPVQGTLGLDALVNF